jgi:hypothetical protein
MATSDLCELLKKQQSSHESPTATGSPTTTTTTAASSGSSSYYYIDIKLEKAIFTTVLRLLHDKSNDVQAIAVKTLGVLITTIYNTDIMVEISNSLLDQIIDESKLDLRDIYTAGLRTVIQTCDVSIGTPVTQTLIPRLLDTIRTGQRLAVTTTTTTMTTSSSSSSEQYQHQKQQQKWMK